MNADGKKEEAILVYVCGERNSALRGKQEA